MAQSPDDGLRLRDYGSLAAALDGYHLYHAARADVFRRAGRYDEATIAYRRALGLTSNALERAYLERRLHDMQTALERS
jgi:RNA polymerase sigma-70 factor (ECF subfamily)